jgi:hypothetical protein
MPRLQAEPALFCLAWATLAIAGAVLANIWVGALLSAGLFAILLPTSMAIVTKTEDLALERKVRWGILLFCTAGLAIWVWR